jgi:(p)ppGpp synthase/HD superfamily hydrolase
MVAAYRHGGQVRKYTGEPYINHPAAVVALLGKAGYDADEILAAGWLHDTVEDTGMEIEEIRSDFGQKVATLVAWVSDVSKPTDGDRAARKKKDRDHIAQGPPEAMTLKLADTIDNSLSIVARDPDFAAVYMAEKRDLLTVLKPGDKWLYAYAKGIVDQYYASLRGAK